MGGRNALKRPPLVRHPLQRRGERVWFSEAKATCAPMFVLIEFEDVWFTFHCGCLYPGTRTDFAQPCLWLDGILGLKHAER
jgi:hypothetical protein